MLDIITVTKDDFDGLNRTLFSTSEFRKIKGVHQIVVDSSSTEIAAKNKALAEKAKVDYYFQPPAGISAAFNFGLAKSKAKWVWYLNGGDELDKNVSLETVVNLMQNSLAEMLVFEITIGDKVTNRPPIYALWPIFPVWIPHPGTIILRSLLQKHNGFNPKYKVGMDAELFFRILSAGAKADLISMSLANFSSGGASGNLKRRSIDGRNIMLKYFGVILRLWFKNMLDALHTLFSYLRSSIKRD